MLVSVIVEMVSVAPPRETVAPAPKPVPATLTVVPPALAPLEGDTDVTVGAGAAYVKHAVHVELCASGFVTVTFTAPAV
jgi:hypothetical protein